MKARIKETGEVLRVLDLDSERILVKYGSEVKSLRIHEVDLIAESVNDYPKVEPNWEQRRFEIAKDVLSASFSTPMENVSIVSYIKDCVQIADILIEELKGGKQ
ncbi:hypothetical protein [Prevotella sp. HUN102]|uniref:hypothetical protein n=1 Tax=Prevotella sp. HUN102 TaxID=1392486 RepID=UPI000559E4BF|nr:hypothetical protein [Prevotella sp. HUN102]